MSLVAFLMFVAASTTGCAVGMNPNRQVFATHVDPSIASERQKAFDAQPWGFSCQRNCSWRTALRAIFAPENTAEAWGAAIAAAERIPEAVPVKESVPADVLDRLDAATSGGVAGPQQVAQRTE